MFIDSHCHAYRKSNPFMSFSTAEEVIARYDAAAAFTGGYALPENILLNQVILVVPFALAAAMGAYLFFAQHNFVGMRIVPIEQWTHYRGALESSSYMKLGPIMQWVTGNIGYHHIHHLNALIPFYRLPEAMAAIPELQTPAVTSLRPRDMIACLRLNLWDLNKAQLVAYGEA